MNSPPTTKGNVAYWATLDHAFTWVVERDKQLLATVKSNNGVIDENSGREIAGRCP